MNAPAAVTLRRQGAPDLLIAYAAVVAAMPVNPDARRIRRNGAARLLAMHPQLAAWMGRPTPARLADIKRTGAWPFLTWCFAEGHLMPDLDLLVAKDPGDLYHQWRIRNPGDVQMITEVAQRFGWSANWTRDVSRGGLALICLTAGKTLSQLSNEDFAGFARALAEAPSAGLSDFRCEGVSGFLCCPFLWEPVAHAIVWLVFSYPSLTLSALMYLPYRFPFPECWSSVSCRGRFRSGLAAVRPCAAMYWFSWPAAAASSRPAAASRRSMARSSQLPGRAGALALASSATGSPARQPITQAASASRSVSSSASSGSIKTPWSARVTGGLVMTFLLRCQRPGG